jgi:hypothetical protein
MFTGQALKKTARTTRVPLAPLLTIYLPAGYLIMVAGRQRAVSLRRNGCGRPGSRPSRCRPPKVEHEEVPNGVPDRRDRGVSRCRE